MLHVLYAIEQPKCLRLEAKKSLNFDKNIEEALYLKKNRHRPQKKTAKFKPIKYIDTLDIRLLGQQPRPFPLNGTVFTYEIASPLRKS